MRETRRFILILSSAVGIWILGSFAGAMLNPANAAFWSGSLMWSLLAGLLVAPGLLIIHHASRTSEQSSTQKVSTRAASTPKPFVSEEGRRTLWPEGSRQAAETAADTARETAVHTAGEDEWPHTREEVPA